MDINSPRDALDNKISSIYQEFNLVPTLSIAENIFLGKEIAKTRLGNLDRKAMIEESSGTLSKLGLEHFDLATKVRKLSVAQQQMIEIGKGLRFKVIRGKEFRKERRI